MKLDNILFQLRTSLTLKDGRLYILEKDGTFSDKYLLLSDISTQIKGAEFLESLDVNADVVYCNQYTQSGVLTIANTFSNGANSFLYVPIITDGSAINFPVTWKEIVNDYVNDNAIYRLIVFYDGYYYMYNFEKVADISVQLNAPVLTSVAATSSSTIDCDWTDTNTSPNELGFTIQHDTVNTFDSVNLIEITGITADLITYLITTLNPSTQYYVRIKAVGNGSTLLDSNWSNILNDTTLAFTTLLTDDFTGTVIDTGIWSITNTSTDGVFSQNDKLYFTLIQTTTESGFSNVGVVNIKSIVDMTVNAEAELDLNWLVEALGRTFYIGYFVDISNYFMILRTSASPYDKIRIIHRSAGTSIYDFSSAVQIPKTIRIIKNNNDYSVFYESSPSVWTQIGATSSGTLTGTVKFAICPTWGVSTTTNPNYIEIDNITIKDTIT